MVESSVYFVQFAVCREWEAVNTGPAHIKIRFPWNVGLESFSSYSMLQGRARIQTLIKITQLFFFLSLLYNHKLLQAEKDNVG